MLDKTNTIWGDLFAEPVFIFTLDQDWAPEWAMKASERILPNEIPVHLFITNPSEMVDKYYTGRPGLSLGIHPNFMPNSTQGKTVNEIIDYCCNLAPRANTFRCHTFFEHSFILEALYKKGFIADSNLGLFHQPFIEPLFQIMGTLRFPTYFTDDDFCIWQKDELNLEPLKHSMFTAGLKIFAFHPIFIACNIPSWDYYQQIKEDAFNSGADLDKLIFKGRGIGNVLLEIIESINNSGHTFHSFPEIVDKTLSHLRDSDFKFLYKRW